MSAFEIAIAKGDFVLVSELSRQELTLEDFIDGFITLWRRLARPKGRELDLIREYHAQHFDQSRTCEELGISLEQFQKALAEFRQRLGLAEDYKVEDALDGYIHLWRRLGCPTEEDGIDWMVVYRALGFRRKEAAQELGWSVERFKKFLIAKKKELGITARSVRHR